MLSQRAYETLSSQRQKSVLAACRFDRLAGGTLEVRARCMVGDFRDAWAERRQ